MMGEVRPEMIGADIRPYMIGSEIRVGGFVQPYILFPPNGRRQMKQKTEDE